MREDLWAYLAGLEAKGMHLGLERMRELSQALGHPELAYKTIHVLGTNGKTSTARMLSAILQAHGHKVGTYVSPHLVSPAERQLINGRVLSDKEFVTLAEEVREVVEQVDAQRPADDRITQFEFLTAVAFECFRRAGCDVAVIEAGLGGRLDATAIVSSSVQVLTGIGLDHLDYLGPTQVHILEEKAAVIPQGGRVMAGFLADDLKNHLRSICQVRRAELRFADEDVSVLSSVGGSSFDLFGIYGMYEDLSLKLLGSHQRQNAVVAVGAAELFMGSALDPDAVRRALADVTVPGRLEMVCEKPLCFLDGAHNPQGIEVLMRTIREAFPRRRVIAVVSILRDKDAKAMVEQLVPGCDIIFATKSSNPRALACEELAELIERSEGKHGRGPSVFIDEDPCSALRSAYQLASSNQIVLVTGSLYLVGDIKRALCL